MLALTPTAMALIGAVAALWLVGAVWAIASGVAMRREAKTARRQVDRLADLLQSAPAIPVMIRPDGRIEAPDRLARWLGREAVPHFVSELVAEEGGIEPDHARALAEDIAAAQRAGRAFAIPVSARGSDRSLLVRGTPASPELAPGGSVVLWIFDATESQSEIAGLRDDIARYRAALEALSGVIEAAPMPIWHRGPDQRLTLVNSQYVHAVDGASAAQVIEQGTELIEPQDGLTPASAAAKAAEGGRALARLVPATIDGERRMIRVVDVPLGPGGVAGYAIDVQELEEARAEYKRLVAAHRDMLDRLSAGVAQFGADHRLQFCNQPFMSLFGLTPDAVAGGAEFDRVLDDMRLAGRLPEHRDFPAWRAERRDWFLSPAAREENWHLPDGVHLRVYAQPLPDGGLLLIFEDRTEQLQLSSARDTLLRVRTATFDNLFEAIGVFAADGRLHLWNSRFRQIWGAEEGVLAAHPRVDELMNRFGDRLARPQHAGLVQQLIRAATVERRQRGGRVAFADGRYFEFAAIPLPDGNALFVMLDISDSRKIEQALRDRNEALEEADRVKTAFVSNMSYELRTPLTSIAGFAEMMQAGYAGTLPPQARDYVDAIMESTGRLARLIDNVLDLTQGATGGLPIERKPVALEALARAAIGRVEAAATSRGITLVADLKPNLGSIKGDQRRLAQALDHLIDNALRYVGEGGRVLVHGDGTHKTARLVVSDDGPGIDPKAQARLFNLFNQVDKIRGGETAGLGLPLARQCVEAHGGTLELISEPGQGTVVTMELPRG
jgi:signal transduction histidine kinase